MSCNKCKKKRDLEFLEQEIKKVEGPMTIILIAVGLLSIYGIYELLLKIFSLF